MKALTSFAIAIAATFFFACNTPISSQLKDDVQRKTLISELVANRDYTTQVMDAMMTNDNAKQMMTDHNMKMMDDPSMHTKMMDHMMSMMEKDTTMCKDMCEKMMSNPNMKTMMQNMMKHDMKMDMKPSEKMNHK
jgi:uncharacterized membrane protein YhiD involved in acid resistance